MDKEPGQANKHKFKFYSDLYLVKTTDKDISLAEAQNAREYYATDANSDLAFGNPLRRIVDYPSTNTPVIVPHDT